MRLYNYLTEQYKFPSNQTIESDFNEYKKKEDNKWKQRASVFGFRFPIFNTIEQFENDIQNAEIIELTGNIRNQIEHMTSITDMEELRDLVQSYRWPRDIDRIIQGYEQGDLIPYPIILKGNRGMHIMAGNTRQNVAYILGITSKALLIDISEE